MSLMFNHRVLGAVLLAVGLRAAEAAPRDFEAEFKTVASRVEALGGRAVSESEWKAASEALERLAADAERAGRLAVAVDARVLLGRAWGFIRQDTDRALALLRQTRHTFSGKGLPGVRGAYIAEAEFLARRGDADAIRRLITQFKTGPDYDAEPFVYAVGEGPDTPLAIRRPSQRGSDSLTVTALQKFLDQAVLGVGAPLPDFSVVDLDGRTLTRDSLKGKVVVLDFWVAGAVASENNRPHLAQALERHAAKGLVVVGFAQNLEGAALRDFQSRQPRMTWAQVPAPAVRALAARLGIRGDPANVVVDRQGLIRGRNLQAADLAALVRQVVEEQP